MEKKPVRSKEERIRLRPSKRLCPSLRPSGVLQPSTEACCRRRSQRGLGRSTHTCAVQKQYVRFVANPHAQPRKEGAHQARTNPFLKEEITSCPPVAARAGVLPKAYAMLSAP